MEKKEIKIGLGAFILLIVLLLAAIGGCVYLFLTQNKNKDNALVNEIEQNLVTDKNTTNEVETSSATNKTVATKKEEDEDVLSGTKLKKLLEPEDAWFCIKEGKKEGNDYIITAVMLDDERRVITEEEYEDILAGKEFKFRGLKWTLNKDMPNFDYTTIKSGEKKLVVMQDDDTGLYYLQNIAGVATTGLKDFSSDEFKFKVSKDVIIGQFFTGFEYDEEGNLKITNIDDDEIIEKPDTTVDELLEMAKRNSGTYEECRAFVKNGVVEAIQILNK